MTLVWAWLDRVDSSYLSLTVSLNINIMVLNPQSVGGKITITRGMILTVAQGWIETLAFFLCCSALSLSHRARRPQSQLWRNYAAKDITEGERGKGDRARAPPTSQFIRVTEQRALD